MASTFEAAAFRYLDQWVLDEEPLRERLLLKSDKTQRAALQKAATFFRVIRTLRRANEDESSVPRLELARQCLARISAADVSDETFVVVTEDLARELASRYGGGNLLSVASKLLWLKHRHPVVIYDERVRQSLGTKSRDYASYVEAWHDRYMTHEAAIIRACRILPEAHRFLRCSPVLSAGDIRQIAREEWFRRRVMDIFIWLGGA